MDQSERYRRLAGLVLLVIGLAFLAVSVVIVTRRSCDAPHVWPAGSSDSATAVAQARYVLWGLLLLVVVVLGFIVAALAMVRWSRRFRANLLRRRRPATPYDDIWSMHRLPDEPDEQNAQEVED